uniref:Uncharacterized protein n=1 Tax=Mustela putorius furo TaxID=9669 RepID=M3YBJ6_MUSPF
RDLKSTIRAINGEYLFYLLPFNTYVVELSCQLFITSIPLYICGIFLRDSKALKDENLPPVICQDVENLQKFVKEQKQVQEEISRMSSKAMLKVQKDIKTLKQLLSLAASRLQRNTLSIDKLKIETAQVN